MMRCQLISIVGAAFGMTLVPACSPLLRQTPADLLGSPTVNQEESAHESRVVKTPDPPRQLTAGPSEASRAVGSEILVDKVRYPAMAPGAELIPEPRKPDKTSVAARPAQPPEQEPLCEPGPAKVKPPEDPPVVQVMRCLVDKRPAEAIALLERYDKQSQDLLLAVLPLAVRLAEKDGQRTDSRELGTLLDQLGRVMAPLRRRAPLRIKEMYLCKDVAGFGKYKPLAENYGFRLGEMANLYVELQNLVDERQGNSYSFHLLTNIEIRDFNTHIAWSFKFDDPGPNFSRSERHDFYHLCTFHIPINKPRLAPGLYTLYVRITDLATGREAERTLDFRVASAYGQNGS
jgi:hypothetical protein